ncbi:response regulator (plasmid) [Pseudomonas sp. HR96]|uniref:response regulator n=1 Tax=Pseudomonas sp. HR96 TaxID=1027966 RepID=UPI002A74A39D|nr:response regulator [Pseudomonas sp. HR96]WPP02386.1 response regulator [Pseudomonas sp. HR96]
MPITTLSSSDVPLTGNIVIVEDDELMHRLMVDIFTDLGADCASFFSADDALIHMMQVKSPCALLVTDFTLPGQLDGRELALMVHQRWPHVPVIVTTGYGSEVGNDLPRGVAFLRKPWSLEQIAEMAREMMHLSRKPAG